MQLFTPFCLAALFVSASAIIVNTQAESDIFTSWPNEAPNGFYVNLNELRLVKFGYNEEPVWITENQKVSFFSARFIM
jgi:hypothetical protein